jgi:hypothetical protein
MTTLRNHLYWGIWAEELHEARRRAHAERAKAVRVIISALVSWRRKLPERRTTAELTPAHVFLPPAN